jgi:hypothetical protein
MNKSFFLYLISIALITGCTDLPNTPGVTTAAVTSTGTATAYPPIPEAATTSVSAPTSENYGLYTDSDLQIYADTLDARIQAALKNNDINEAQTLGFKRQELIAEFNRRGLKRRSVEPAPRSHYSRKIGHRRSRVTQPQSKINPSGAGLPGED